MSQGSRNSLKYRTNTPLAAQQISPGTTFTEAGVAKFHSDLASKERDHHPSRRYTLRGREEGWRMYRDLDGDLLGNSHKAAFFLEVRITPIIIQFSISLAAKVQSKIKID